MADFLIADAHRQQLGPYPEAIVRDLLLRGTVTLDNLAWRPGMDSWQPLRSFSEFIDIPNPPAARPPLPAGIPAAPLAAPGTYNPYAPPGSAQLSAYAPGTIDPYLPSAVRAGMITEEVLRRGYQLDILSCVGRAWNLLFSRHFWDILGVSTVTFLAIVIASGCYAGIVVNGPIAGGLHLYYLKKIRRQESDLSTAFSGFSLAFAQLFLVYLISTLLGMIGFFLCLIPGIYLAVAWIFSKALVIDKNLEFWDAMEVSRRVVNRNWFAVFGLVLLSGLLASMGIIALGIGLLVTLPLFNLSLMQAYEDIFHPQTPNPHP